MARKPISKRKRFAVLSRDNFTCQYCGAGAPDVVLHIDHVEPVSCGGGNEYQNLITACVDCNLGKHASRLADSFRYDAICILAQAIYTAAQRGLPVREVFQSVTWASEDGTVDLELIAEQVDNTVATLIDYPKWLSERGRHDGAHPNH